MAGQMQSLAETELGQAIMHGTVQDVRKIIKSGQNPRFMDTKGNTYLHFVCTMYRPYIFHVLTASGIDINAQNKHGNTALHVTALHDDCGHVTDLMRAGIDPFIKNQDGKTAAEINTSNKYWYDVYAKYLPGLFKAIDDHDLDMVLHLFQCWCNVDVMKNGKTARQYAAARAYHDIVAIIDRVKHSLRAVYGVLENDYEKASYALSRPECDPNFVKQDGIHDHVLLHAIRQGQLNMVRSLLQAGADVNHTVQLRDYFRGPLFFEAIHHQKVLNGQITSEVIASGADFSLKDERGRTALMYCIDHGDDVNMDVINYLLHHGVSIADRDCTGHTARNIAQLARRQDIVDAIDKHLIGLIRACDVDALWRLAVDGYDSFFIEYNYRDTWIYAAGNETDDVTDFLHKLIPFQGGRTPLIKAVLYANEDLVKSILSIDPSCAVTDKDSCNHTALHYACALGVEGMILQNVLLDFGASEQAANTAGKTPRDLEEIAETEGAEDFAEKEKEKNYGKDMELRCLQKYEILLDIIKSKHKKLKHFLHVLKQLRYPVSSFHLLFQPRGHHFVSHYEDLLFAALDHEKTDIAKYLVLIGANCHRKEKYESEDGSVHWMNAEERARALEMTDLAEFISSHKR